MGEAYLSQRAPQTPVRGSSSQPEQITPVYTSFLSPATPFSSFDEDADSIFSPPSSVYTDATDDDKWDTPTKKCPGQSNRLFSPSQFPSSFGLLKTENLPRTSPETTGPTDNIERFITPQVVSSEKSSQPMQSLSLNAEDLPELISSTDRATPCGHRTDSFLVQAQQSTRGRSASFGHIESYTRQLRATKTTKYSRSRSLDRLSLRCQEGCTELRASHAPPSTPTAPNIGGSPLSNSSNVTTVAKTSTFSNLELPTPKSTENDLFKFDVSSVTFAAHSPDNGTKTNRLAIRGQANERRRTINSVSPHMRKLHQGSSNSNSRHSISSTARGSLRSFSEEFNYHSTSEEAKAREDSSSKVAGHFRMHTMNLKPDMDFLQDGESHHRRSRSSTPVGTIPSGVQNRPLSNYYPKGALRTTVPLNMGQFVHTGIPRHIALDQKQDIKILDKTHEIPPFVGTRIQSGNDQGSPQIGTAARHTDRTYVHQSLIPYCPKRHMSKTIAKVLEEIIVAPLSTQEIQREGHIYIYWHPGNFGRVKIGYTRNIEQRLRDWEKQCKKTLYIHFPREAKQGRPVQHIARVEKLVHAELKNYRKQEVKCPGCGKRHIEWFELDKNVAVDVVKKWTNWMLQMPYIQKGCGDESQWVLRDDARKLLGDICKPHEQLSG